MTLVYQRQKENFTVEKVTSTRKKGLLSVPSQLRNKNKRDSAGPVGAGQD